MTGLDNLSTLALAPRGTPLYQTTYGNIAPVWDLRGSSRRVRWGDSPSRGLRHLLRSWASGSLGGATSYFPYISSRRSIRRPFPLSTAERGSAAVAESPPVSTILVADPHLKLPRTYQWNVALEQPLGSSQSVSTTYIGAIGRDLLR